MGLRCFAHLSPPLKGRREPFMSTATSLRKLLPLLWPTMLSVTETSNPRWIQVAKIGEFFSQRYGNFAITSDDLRQMLVNFTSVTPLAPTQLPVDYDHLSMNPKNPGDGKAAGWFKTGKMELRRGDSELWAEVEFTPVALHAIEQKEYRFISPSFVKDYVWKNGKNIGTTLIAAAITNHPFLEGMASITLAAGLGEIGVAMPIMPGGPVEIGQHVTMKPDVAATMQVAPDVPLAITAVVGSGDDQFAKVATPDGQMWWARVTELEPARVMPLPDVPASDVPEPITMRRDGMNEVFKLRDAHGTEVEVKADGLAEFVTQQLAEAAKAGVPEGSVVISASKLGELEQTGQKVVELSDRVKKSEDAAVAAQKEMHVLTLSTRLDKLSKEGRINKPTRDWAAKQFSETLDLAGFEEWEKTVPAESLVPINIEHGSSATASKTSDASVEINAMAVARSKERGISLSAAATEIANERQDLTESYRNDIRGGGDVRERIVH